MENKNSFLKASSIRITPEIILKIPTVGEILENESQYLNTVSSLTASPYQYMVQLDDMGLDYTTITDYQLFLMMFQMYSKQNLSLIFGDMDISNFQITINNQNGTEILYNPQNNVMIDELTYTTLSEVLRKINALEKVKTKPGNEEAKRYLLEKERKKQARNAKKPYEPYLEKLVIALVNRMEFKYNYEEVMELSIYKFNQSFKQIQTNINFENTMHGVYAGTIDTSKLRDKSCLSWIPQK